MDLLAKFIEDLSQIIPHKTLNNLMEMLRRNKVNGEDITSIKQFTPGSRSSMTMNSVLEIQIIFIYNDSCK
ncbi:unnamed protein product [Rhizophagus irregularis]|nr:unnamed protein product [Rhizophagus irregularis]